MCQTISYRDKCKCINCLKLFDIDQGLNPFYCSQVCADKKNAPTGPAILDDPHARRRAGHKLHQKQLVTAEDIAKGKW